MATEFKLGSWPTFLSYFPPIIKGVKHTIDEHSLPEVKYFAFWVNVYLMSKPSKWPMGVDFTIHFTFFH